MGKTRKPVSLGGSRRYGKLAPGAEDGTPERLAQAESLGPGTVGAEAGVRRLADPFDLMRRQRKLDRSDAAGNERLWEIGDRFRRHWHRSRLDNLTAFDFSRELVDGGTGQGGTPTEAAMAHREILRKAEAAVGPRLLPILRAIAVEGRPAIALVSLIDETGHARTAEALVVERLRESLYRLGDHWGMAPREPRGLPPARAGRGVSPALCRGSGCRWDRAPP